MTVPNLGYGGSSSANYNTLQGLVSEFAAAKFITTTNNSSALLKSGALTKVPAEGREIVIEAEVGSNPTTMYIQDYGRRPVGQTATPAVGRVVPSNITAQLSLGQTAALTKLKVKDLAMTVNKKLENISKDVARFTNRGIYGASQAPQAGTTWTSTAANATATIPFLDVSMFKPNASYDFVDLSSSKSYVVRCTGIVMAAVGANSANVAGNVSFINDVPDPLTGVATVLTDTTIAVGDLFKLRGTTAGFGGSSIDITGAKLNSYDDIAGSGAALAFLGIDPATTPGWVGQRLTLAGIYSQEAALQFAARVNSISGEKFTHAIMPPMIAAAHEIMSGNQGGVYGIAAGQSSGTRTMTLDSSMDKYGEFSGSGLKLLGRPVLIDDNCPATTVILHNKDQVKLGVWKEMGPDDEDGNTIFMNRQTFSIDAYFSGTYQLYCENRSTIGIMDGITGL